MNHIKNIFSIREFEDISGIKAHTIRIWEKRYNLFEPQKTKGNIRRYDISELQKVLNVAFLNNNGYRISKIAALSNEELAQTVRSLVEVDIENYFLSQLKLAMYSFDASLFDIVYQEAIANRTFKEVFLEIYVPLLEFVGYLWQTDSISPAHEHFVSNLIYQKIQLNTAQLYLPDLQSKQPVYVLFLPEREMHEIGLLYLNYELKSKGFSTIYLGRSISLAHLEKVKAVYANIIWVCTVTVAPPERMLRDYLEEAKKLTEGTEDQFWMVGQKLSELGNLSVSSNLKLYLSLKEVLSKFP
ncbi:MAG: MerR family transcriptional regulator [Bacteroidota bacterium]